MKSIRYYLNPGLMLPADEFKPTTILLLAALLPSIHKYFGSMEFYTEQFRVSGTAGSSLYLFLTTFLLLGIIPLLLTKFIFREPLFSYGIKLGDWRFGLRFTFPLFILIGILLLIPSSQTMEMRNFYPLHRGASNSVLAFAQYEFLRVVFFYTAWEFFFRGFMLFGMRRYTGNWLAICIQTIPSCLWHIGMPAGEIFASVAGGIVFGIMAVRSGSILWPWLLHCLIGIGLDFFIVIT